MEALLERGTEMERWNDARLDELSQTMKEGFAKVDKRFEQVDQRFEQMGKRFEKVDQRFVSLEGQIKEGFERLDDRLFKVMLLMLILFGGLMTTLIAALLGVGGS
ncbi:MAG: hypothetical protein ACJ75T_02220 [Solirubrobacterales bacterium]